MAQKEKQCAYWFLTINNNAECYSSFIDIIKNLCIDYPKLEYSYIYHTEKEKDDNVNENHIHCVLYFKNSVKRFTTMQNIFVGAHIEVSNKQRYFRCIQYLIHKNDVNKFQYDRSCIFSNIPTPVLDDILCGTGYEFEFFDCCLLDDYINDCVSIHGDMFYFIKRFGIDAIKPYYFIIKDLLLHTSARESYSHTEKNVGNIYYN